jgi:hypothetical protein
MDGLTTPQGMALRNNRLFVLDNFTKELIAFDMSSAARRTIAARRDGSNYQSPREATRT